jgi:hypothetical protein
VADVTTLQVRAGDISNVIVSSGDVTAINVQDSDVTTIVGAPVSVTIESELRFSDATPSDITRAGASGILELASRSDHVHSIANTLLDGGNY